MLSESERLRRASLFQRTYAAKKVVSSELFTLYVLARHPKGAPKLPLVGFVIGKKVESKAVQRNRAKRRAREAYKRVRYTLLEGAGAEKLKQWYAMVWVIKSAVLEAPFESLCRQMEECIRLANAKYGQGVQGKIG